MTRPALTPAQVAQAVELRAAGLSWSTIAVRLGVSKSTARTMVVRELQAQGKSLAPTRSGRPYGSRTRTRKGAQVGSRAADLFRESLARAWLSRRWPLKRVARILGVGETTLRRWCR